MTVPTDQIWAYLHNQLTSEQKEEFEHALVADPDLRTQLEKSRSTHEQLSALLPNLEQPGVSDEQLVEQLIAEWETENPEHAEQSKPTHRRKIITFTVPLAAAAAALILMTLPAGPIDWQRTAYGSAPQLRGELAAQPHYSRSELKQISHDLQDAIELACTHPDQWTLKLHMQELANGALSLEVTGWARLSILRKNETGHNVIRWNENFLRLQDLRHNLSMVGKQIADKL